MNAWDQPLDNETQKQFKERIGKENGRLIPMNVEQIRRQGMKMLNYKEKKKEFK